jgi:hypothetical protein
MANYLVLVHKAGSTAFYLYPAAVASFHKRNARKVPEFSFASLAPLREASLMDGST